MLEFVHGDMFDTPVDIRVNTVNCVGVMGTGVALAFKKRYPEMFRDYQHDCKEGRVKPGAMHVWRSLGDWIINFPTKRDWREPSRYEDIDSGLDDLRRYLDKVGRVRIALPALGCGNGGLDWQRVSGMIRDKLEGIDAHVLVFAPAASHLAATAAPTVNERAAAEQLGFTVFEPRTVSAGDAPAPIYASRSLNGLSGSWIALLPSRAPGERELQALRSIAAELGRRDSDSTVALVHGSRASEEVADIFATQGIATVLLLPFGVLTRKTIAKLAISEHAVPLTLASLAPAAAKWSRPLFAQTMELLRANAAAVLLSDPEPDWLGNNVVAKWGRVPISYIRYEAMLPVVREALTSIDAKAIGRRGEDGAPNLDHLLGELRHSRKPDDGGQRVASQSDHADGSQTESETLSVVLDHRADEAKQALFAALLRTKLAKLAATIKLSSHISDADRCRLSELGFVLSK
jgi:O-acetyl-ADP-ribose deacetylase (regulator of RNase III)